MTDKKPHVHELKAHDFFLDRPHDTMSGGPRIVHGPPWQQMASFPQDGRAVDVILDDDRICVVCWRDGKIVGDGFPAGAIVKYWRARS